MNLLKACWVLLLLTSARVDAGTIVFSLAGQVISDAINGCGGFVNCGKVSVSYTFDSAAPDLNPMPDTGLYAATNISFRVDGVLIFSSAAGLINVAHFPQVDQYGVVATGTASNSSTADLSILLSDPTATTLSSDALPQSVNALLPMFPGTFQLNAADDSFQLAGSILPVPEPTSGVLLAAGIPVLLALGRRFAIGRLGSGRRVRSGVHSRNARSNEGPTERP